MKSANPAGALVFPPLVGQHGHRYTPAAIRQAETDIEAELRNGDLNLHVVKGSLVISDKSLHRNSDRSRVITFWVITSEVCNAGKQRIGFLGSYLATRTTTMQPLVTSIPEEMVNPTSKIPTLGGRNLSKAGRTKQWLSGLLFWNEIRKSTLTWMDLDASYGVNWVDLIPWDSTLLQSVLNQHCLSTHAQPLEMLTSVVWTDIRDIMQGAQDLTDATQAANNTEASLENQRIVNYLLKCRTNIATKCVQDKAWPMPSLGLLEESAITPAPALDTTKFQYSMPLAGNLPIRQEWMTSMEAKLKTTEAKQAFASLVKVHNEEANPSGVPWKGDKKRTAETVEDPVPEALMDLEGEPKTAGDLGTDGVSKVDGAIPNCVNHTLLVKDGKLYMDPHEDAGFDKQLFFICLCCSFRFRVCFDCLIVLSKWLFKQLFIIKVFDLLRLLWM